MNSNLNNDFALLLEKSIHYHRFQTSGTCLHVVRKIFISIRVEK